MISTIQSPFINNKGGIKLVKNLVFHAHTKHKETHCHFVCEKMLTQDINLLKIRTKEQVTDILIKTLSRAKFEVLRCALGVNS